MTRSTPRPLCLSQPASGNGAPVILLHGSAGGAEDWRGLREHLEGRFHVLAPDLPGYGTDRDPESGRPATLAGIADRVGALVERFDRPVHLVGHDFGAAVALKAAERLVGQVRSLTLIEPAAFGPLWTARGPGCAEAADFVAACNAAAVALAEGDAWTAMRHHTDYWNGAGAWDRSSFGLRQRLAARAGQVLRDVAALTADRSTEQDLAGVVCPALCIRGDRSPAAMDAISARLSETLPFLRTETVAAAGHMVAWSDPHLVDPMISEFLEKVDCGWQDVRYPAEIAA